MPRNRATTPDRAPSRPRHNRSPARPAPTGRATAPAMRDLLAEPALGERQRGLALALGLGLDQVGEPFGLGQVDAAVLERAAGEFARLGQPQARRSTPVRRAPRRPPPGRHGIGIPRYLRRSSSPGRRTAGPAPRRATRRSADAASSRTAASRGSGSAPAISARRPRAPAGPLTRITAIAAGGRPLDSAKMVSASHASGEDRRDHRRDMVRALPDHLAARPTGSPPGRPRRSSDSARCSGR